MRVLDGAAGAGAHRRAVAQARCAVDADPAFAEDRRLDHAQHRARALRERDQRAEQRIAGDEALGAVDRVEHPGELASRLGGKFLAVDAVGGELGADHAPHLGLDGAVGDGDRAEVGFLLDLERLAKIAARDGARRVGEPLRQRERFRVVAVPGEIHGLQYNQLHPDPDNHDESRDRPWLIFRSTRAPW